MSHAFHSNPSTGSLPQGTFGDPDAPSKIDAAALDYLIIELTNTLKHSSVVATERTRRQEAELIEGGLLAPIPPRKDVAVRDSAGASGSVVSTTRAGGNTTKNGLSEAEEAVGQRLETMGTIVGGNLAERLSRSRSTRFSEPLDVVKFLCKDVWTAIWDKPVDNLRTNHRVSTWNEGVYVLQDNSFKPLLRISSPQGAQEGLRQARLYLAYPAGLIKGALQRLGLSAAVIPEVTTLPQCTFQVKLPKAGP